MKLMSDEELKNIENEYSEQSIRLYDLEESLLRFYVYKRMSDANEVEYLGMWLRTERNKTQILILQLENLEERYLKSDYYYEYLKLKKKLNKAFNFLENNYKNFEEKHNFKKIIDKTTKNLDVVLVELDLLRSEINNLKTLNN